MGGVSSGQVTLLSEGDWRFARMTGAVSTENNGGFIQMRLDLPQGAAAGADGVRLIVRGNSQRYFVHLRTGGTRLPWQYYQAGFEVGPDWAEVRLPFDGLPPLRRDAGAGSGGGAADLAGCRGLWARPRRPDRRGRGRVLLTLTPPAAGAART
jgi:hypothetical protein